MKQVVLMGGLLAVLLFNGGCAASSFVSLRISEPSKGEMWVSQPVQVLDDEDVKEAERRLVGYLFYKPVGYHWKEKKWLKLVKKVAVSKFGGDAIYVRYLSGEQPGKHPDLYSYTVRVYRDDQAVVTRKKSDVNISVADTRLVNLTTALPGQKKEALSLLKPLALNDSPEGCLEYGRALMAEADGADARLKAAQWFCRSWELGCADAACEIGDLFRKGVFGKKDTVEAYDWYLKGAESGSVTAWAILGDIYYFNNAWESGRGALASHLEKGTPIDDCASTFLLTRSWVTPQAQTDDMKRAFKAVWRSMDKDCAPAWKIIFLGLKSKNVPQDLKNDQFEEAIRRAKSGQPECMKLVGACYEYGLCIKANPRKAVEWTLKSANAGYWEGCWDMKRYYENGIGVERDLRLSEEWRIKMNQCFEDSKRAKSKK